MKRLKPCPVCGAKFLPIGQVTCSRVCGKVHAGTMPERRRPDKKETA